MNASHEIDNFVAVEWVGTMAEENGYWHKSRFEAVKNLALA